MKPRFYLLLPRGRQANNAYLRATEYNDTWLLQSFMMFMLEEWTAFEPRSQREEQETRNVSAARPPSPVHTLQAPSAL